MAEGNEKCTKKPQKSKLDFFSLYEQLENDNPAFTTNKTFWSRKGNSQKYLCTLCNIGVQMSSNVTTLKTSILTHINDKHHQKKLEKHLSTKDQMKNNADLKLHTNITKVMKQQGENDDKSILDIVEKSNELLLSTENASDNSEPLFKNNRDVLADFDTIYDSFEKTNPVIKTSKQFITKLHDGRHYFCTLCKVLIFNPLNTNEFKYNLWVHLNDESHREQLPNYKEVQRHFRKVMKELSEKIPSSLIDDLKYFDIGPMFRFVKCSLCEVAVSVNLHRLENHIQGPEHIENKEGKKELKKESLSDRTRTAFRKLIVKLEDPFKKDIKYIQIGKIPGYVVCTLCSYVVLPTQFFVQTHLESPVHLKNKCTSKVNKYSKFKVRLEDLMKTLPDDLKSFNIFEENLCGLTCKRCKDSIPATSYDLYSHINKERHAVVG